MVAEIAAQSPNALATGPFGSSISSKYFQDEGVPVIRGSNLSENVGFRLVEQDFVYLSEEKARQFSRSIVRAGDLIFTCWGTIGQVGLVEDTSLYKEYVISNKQMKVTPDPKRVDSRFLYYMFSSPEMQTRIKGQAIGSSVPGFNLGQLRSLSFDLPPLREQRAIASILSSLDDKIELNRQLNATLEATARAIFKSWFVDFDPVQAKAAGEQPSGMDAATAALFPDAFEESELGLIPQGWRVGTLGDIANNPRRSIRPEDIAGETPYIGLQDMPQKSIALAEWGSGVDVESNKYVFSEGEILFGKLRPYFHKVGVAPVDGVCSTDILVVTPKKVTFYSFVLETVSSDELIAYTTATSGGTRMPRTSWHDLAAYPVVLPPDPLVECLDSFVRPMVVAIKNNTFEARTLSHLRDELLPKLVSGQVRVQDIDANIEELPS